MEKIDLGEIKTAPRFRDGVHQTIRLFTKTQRELIMNAVDNRPDNLTIEDAIHIYNVSPAVYYTWKKNKKRKKLSNDDQETMTQSNKLDEVRMFLFARWIAASYADEHMDDKMRYTDDEDFDSSTSMSILNRKKGDWYKRQLRFFNDVIYPGYIRIGVVSETEEFLNR